MPFQVAKESFKSLVLVALDVPRSSQFDVFTTTVRKLTNERGRYMYKETDEVDP